MNDHYVLLLCYPQHRRGTHHKAISIHSNHAKSRCYPYYTLLESCFSVHLCCLVENVDKTEIYPQRLGSYCIVNVRSLLSFPLARLPPYHLSFERSFNSYYAHTLFEYNYTIQHNDFHFLLVEVNELYYAHDLRYNRHKNPSFLFFNHRFSNVEFHDYEAI